MKVVCSYLCPHFVYNVKAKVRTLDIAPLRDTYTISGLQKRSGMARVLNGSQFYLHTHTLIRNRNEPYLLLPSKLVLIYLGMEG